MLSSSFVFIVLFVFDLYLFLYLTVAAVSSCNVAVFFCVCI